MKLFFGKGKEIQNDIYSYLDVINQQKELFMNVLENYIQKGDMKELAKAATEIHEFESSADDKRRQIGRALYGRALLPEFRGDVFRLMERIDRLPNECQTITYIISQQNMVIPKLMNKDLLDLVRVNCQSITEVVRLVHVLFEDPKSVNGIVDGIDSLESQSDKIERDLISKIFSSSRIDKSDRILLKELILEIGSLSDIAEVISDMVTIITIKVKV